MNWKNIFIRPLLFVNSMKSLAIVIIFAMFVPITAFAQTPSNFNQIIIETVPDSTDVSVTINGELEQEGNVGLSVWGWFDSDSKEAYEQGYTFTNDNPTHIFDLDYTFQANEVYYVTVTNGGNGQTIKWIPLLVTQEASTNSIEVLPLVLGQLQTTSVLISNQESDLFESVRDENKLLSQETQKKDAVLMEQVMVIQDLASQISNVMYTNSLDSVSLTVAQIEPTTPKETFNGYVDYLSEENILLNQEIEKKNAVLMEQLKVIQDLASKVKNTIFEPTLSNFSLV